MTSVLFIPCQLFPIPKIQDLLLKLEGFQYATSLDFNMGYYHIELSPFSHKLCMIVQLWGKYEYLCLPMGLINSSDIFQEKMSTLMDGLEFVRTYLADCLCLTSEIIVVSPTTVIHGDIQISKFANMPSWRSRSSQNTRGPRTSRDSVSATIPPQIGGPGSRC